MITVCWTDWTRKQMADLSTRLLIQGYAPADIQRLCAERGDFRDQFARFESQFDRISTAMFSEPDGYHHFDELTRAKMELLQFTNLHREVVHGNAFKQPRRLSA